MYLLRLVYCVVSGRVLVQTLPLRLELEFPAVRAAPPQLDLRVVPDGDTRKCYFSVSHSSRESHCSPHSHTSLNKHLFHGKAHKGGRAIQPRNQ